MYCCNNTCAAAATPALLQPLHLRQAQLLYEPQLLQHTMLKVLPQSQSNA
jgi:hypothetical protein